MKKLFNIWLIILAILLLLTGFLSWLLATNQGARFFRDSVIRYIPANIETGNISGKLAGGFNIEGVAIRFQSWEISSKRLYIRWSPLHLLGGWIGIREIVIEELVVNDLFPKVRNAHDLSWPHAKGILSWIKVRVKVLRITNIAYKEAGRDIFQAEKFHAQIIWYLGGLNVRSFHLKTPVGIADGSIGADFTRPNFLLNSQIKPNHPFDAIDGYHLALKLEAATHPLQISGPVTLIGLSEKNEQVKLSGILGITQSTISFNSIELKEMGRTGTISGNFSVDVSFPQRPYTLNISVNEMSLTKNNKSSTQLSGIMQAKGDATAYSGSFSVKNIAKSWKDISLEGQLKGNRKEIKIFAIRGRALNGSFGGEFHASWIQDLKVSGILEARNLDPALITPDWPGVINADLLTELTFAGFDYPEGKVKANFLKSIVRKRPLTGNVDAQWAKGLFSITRGELHGNGFDINARGILQDKIDYHAAISDLGGLIPHATGRLSASGWLRLNEKVWGGIAAVEGHDINADKFKIDSVMLNAQVNERSDEVLRAKMQARNAFYGPINLGSSTISLEGKLSNHDVLISLVWPKSSYSIVANGAYNEGKWHGTLSKIEGKDAYAGVIRLVKPVALNISKERTSLTSLILSGNTGETIDIAGDLTFNPLKGNFTTKWERLNLARANQVYKDVKIEGLSSGSLEGQVLEKERIRLSGGGMSTFTITRGPIMLRGSSVGKLNCDEKGTRATWETGFTDGGKLEGQFVSNEPAYFRRPEFGEMRATWRDIDVVIFKPWIPQAIDLKGKLSGAVRGSLTSASRFEISGDTKITGGSFTWNGEGGVITSSAENASLYFDWKDQAFTGNLDVRFPSHGKVKGTFNIPVSAHFPVTITKTGVVTIQAGGEIRERGIISSLFPGLIEESRGQLTFEVTRKGTWETPDVTGRVKLENATAYLPVTGTRIKEVALDALFVEDRIELTSFIAKSGPGKMQGTGTFWLKEFGIAKFKAKLEGKNFQAIYLPELQVFVDPDITFEGQGNKTFVTGKIFIPEALLRDSRSKAFVRSSDDVVVLDAHKKEKKPLKVDADIQATVIMGDKVRIQVGGLDGRMEGNVLLTGQLPEKLLGKGSLRIINGKYDSYGIKLDVTRGNIIFDSRPVELASLDIMAIRIFNSGKLDEVKAGVTVTGTPASPLIKLYSDPPMTDTDVLSYMVLGRPIRAGAESKQTALLLKSASTVLGVSKSGGMQDQIQQLLGIDTLDVQEGPRSAFTSSRTATTSSATLDNSLMTVGKYLSPNLYVSYGRSLFGDQYLVSARYNLSKKLELESKTGMETSVDLFYKIEFD